MPEYGAIEAGGTKFVCAVGSGPDRLRAVERFDTTTPAETLERAIAFLHQRSGRAGLRAVGIASFGPVDLSPSSSSYGSITMTPKPGWAWVDVAGTIGRALGVPAAIDTDANGAALAEHRWGAARGLDTFAYITVGTGIGGGLMANGALIHGLLHPEFGHIRVPHDRDRDPFPGCCPYHDDCLEGLASGRALALRWDRPPEQLPAGHPAWELEAGYLALALATLVCCLSPQRIILGGGVMRQARLFPLVRTGVRQTLAGYLPLRELAAGIDAFIVPPGLGDRSGVLGALALAQRLAER